MRICFIGDSFVNGTGDDDCLGWVGRLCAEARGRGLDVTLYNLGVRRDTSGDIAARWEAEAAARLPQGQEGRLVFSFGVNDAVHEAHDRPRVAEDATLANARLILARALASWPTLVIGPPCTGEAALDARLERLSDRMATLCGELSVGFLPVFAALRRSEVWRDEAARGDGVHPNREGYALLYRAVLAWEAWRDWAR